MRKDLTWVVVRLAFSGKMGAGKTSAAEIVAAETGATRMSFATALKTMCRDYFGMAKKDRDLLQKVGVALREVRPSVWTDIVERTLKSRGGRWDVVIDDLRFPNEAEMLRKHGFIIVEVVASEETRFKRLGSPTDWAETKDHASETGKIISDVVIENNGARIELVDRVREFLHGDKGEMGPLPVAVGRGNNTPGGGEAGPHPVQE